MRSIGINRDNRVIWQARLRDGIAILLGAVSIWNYSKY